MVGVLCADGLRIPTVLRAYVHTDYVELFPEKEGARCTCGALQGVHAIAQNGLRAHGALEGTQAFNDKLAKRIALQNMKEVVYDLDSLGIPVYISGDSLL
eukprot:802108-Pyramimonas_sp.AAC.1